MENDQKRARTEVEMAMAEVARLKTVASDLEKSNEVRKVSLESDIATLMSKIPALENDVSIRVDVLNRIDVQIGEGQALADETKVKVSEVKEQLSSIEKAFAERSLDLHTIETAIKNETNRFDTLLAEKNNELRTTKKAVLDAENIHDSNITKHNIELLKIKKEMIDAEASLATAKDEFATVLRETNRLESESVVFKNETRTLKGDVESLLVEITNLKEEKTNLLASVEPLRSEIEKERQLLKDLTKERIQQHEVNRSIVATLDQREATLREKYEDVGLEYK